MQYLNHLKIDNEKVNHKNKTIVTTLNSSKFEKFLNDLYNFEFNLGVIPAGYEHRADLISNLFYGTPTLDWVICWVNNIKDPFQQLNSGDIIKIPVI